MSKAAPAGQPLMARAQKGEGKRLFGIALRRYVESVQRTTIDAAHDLVRSVATEPADEAALRTVLLHVEREAIDSLVRFLGDSDAMPLLTTAFTAKVNRDITKRRVTRVKQRNDVILDVLRERPKDSRKEVVRALEARDALGGADRDSASLVVPGYDDLPISEAGLDSLMSRLRKQLLRGR